MLVSVGVSVVDQDPRLGQTGELREQFLVPPGGVSPQGKVAPLAVRDLHWQVSSRPSHGT